MNNAWSKWKKISNRVANVQATILFNLVYIVFFIPAGFSRNFFNSKQKKSNSWWAKRKPVKYTIEYARRQ